MSILVIWIHLMNYIQKIKVTGKLKLETAADLVLVKVIFFQEYIFSLNLKQNNSHCKDTGVHGHIKYTLEEFSFSLENKEKKSGVNYAFRSNKH